MKQTTRPDSTTQPRKIPRRNRLSRFVFTLNNYTDDELASIKEYTCKWLIVGKEVAPSTGVKHLQGACVIGKQISFSTLKKYPGFTRAHIESMKGSPSSSLSYCSKEDPSPFQKGEMPQPGRRNDIHDVVDKLRSGRTLESIVEDPGDSSIVPIIKYQKGFQWVASILTKPRSEPPTVVWLYGTTGVGKTRCAFELGSLLGDDVPPWTSSGSLRWFDGYRGQPVAIFDDLRTKHAPFHQLLRLLDRYPCNVEIKGSTVNWNPHWIFVTAPKSPEEMWNLRTPEDIDQLTRRVTYSFDCNQFSDYNELLSRVQSKVGTQEDDEELSESLLPRGLIDLTDGVSSSESDGVPSSQSDESKDEEEQEESFHNLTQLFGEAEKAFNK